MADSSFNDFIVDHHIIGFFDQPLTLKSGRTSHFYINWRDAAGDAFLLDQLTDTLCRFLQRLPIKFDTLYGVPEGATKTALIAALKLAKADPGFACGSHVLAMGRAVPKPHGDPKDRYFIGAPRGRTVILEDTTTTGGSLIACIDHLLAQGIEVVGAIGLTDRMERRDEDGLSVAEALDKIYQGRIPYASLSHALELIPLAVRRQKVSATIQSGLVSEFRRFGVKELNLTGEA